MPCGQDIILTGRCKLELIVFINNQWSVIASVNWALDHLLDRRPSTINTFPHVTPNVAPSLCKYVENISIVKRLGLGMGTGLGTGLGMRMERYPHSQELTVLYQGAPTI